MRPAVWFLMIAVCCLCASGQKQTLTDPFGLTAFGFKEKLESRPLITPSTEPPNSRACGTGVYLREETVQIDKKLVKRKIVIVYFLPDPSTLATFGDYEDVRKMKPLPPREPINQPAGVSSLTVFWPPRIRMGQLVLFARVEEVNGGALERTMSFPAFLDVHEGDSPSILWKYDNYVPGVRAPEIVANNIWSDPIRLKISFPRGARNCIER